MVRSRAAGMVRVAPTKQRTCGREPTRSQRQRHSLTLTLFFLASLLQSAPALKFFFERQFAGNGGAFPFWVQVVLLIAIVEFAFAMSFMRVVDHSTLWILSLLALLIAMTYAFLLASVLFARQGSLLALLELTDSARGVVLPWTCIGMLTLHALVALGAGRAAVAWNHETKR